MQNLIRKVGQGNAMHMAGTRCFLPIEACLEIIFFAQVYETKKIQLQAFLCKFLSDSFYCIDVYTFNFKFYSKFNAVSILFNQFIFSWNREGNDMSQDDNRERSLETNALGDNLSQPQYHFFSMRGNI